MGRNCDHPARSGNRNTHPVRPDATPSDGVVCLVDRLRGPGLACDSGVGALQRRAVDEESNMHKALFGGKKYVVGGIAVAAMALVGGLQPVAVAGAAHHHGTSVEVTPWLSGLNAPRGVAFDRAGGFYVAESGTAGEGTAGFTHTGRVSKYRLGSTTPVWQTSTSSV